MIWVMFVFASLNSDKYYPSMSVTSHEFSSREACITAVKEIRTRPFEANFLIESHMIKCDMISIYQDGSRQGEKYPIADFYVKDLTPERANEIWEWHCERYSNVMYEIHRNQDVDEMTVNTIGGKTFPWMIDTSYWWDNE